MNSADAKKVLILYRPGLADEQDPEIAEALAVTRTDPELATWFRQHCEFQETMRRSLRQLAPPADLKARILASRKVVPLPVAFWRRPATRWMAAAAVVLLLAGGGALFNRPASYERFALYQSRMVASAVRDYHMDVHTSDMARLREHLAAGGAPADYLVPEGLRSRKLTGGGVLKWRGHPVSMVCFDRGDKEMVFLFVTDRSAVKDPPPAQPQVSQVADQVSVSWTSGDKIYTLAGPEEPGFVKKYL